MMYNHPAVGAGVFVNGHALSEFGAKLVTNYPLSGYEIANTYHQGIDRNSFVLFRQTHGLLSITLPLDFYGSSKMDTMEKMTAFASQCEGQVELNLSDGFAYTCMLEEIGATSWANDEICSVDYSFIGIKHKPPIYISGATPLLLYNAATWPRNDCRIIIKNFKITTDTPVVISLSHDGSTYLSWQIDTSSGLYAGGDLVLDGIDKRNLYNAGNVPSNTMVWTDYPYLMPGKNIITVSGALTTADVELYYIPTYL